MMTLATWSNLNDAEEQEACPTAVAARQDGREKRSPL
jgi:hypothetical protein